MKRRRGRPRQSKDIKLSASVRQARRRARLKAEGTTTITLQLPVAFVNHLRSKARESGRTISMELHAIIAAHRAAEGE